MKTDISSPSCKAHPKAAAPPAWRTNSWGRLPGPHRCYAGSLLGLGRGLGEVWRERATHIFPRAGGLRGPKGEEQSPLLGPSPILWDVMWAPGVLLGQ